MTQTRTAAIDRRRFLKGTAGTGLLLGFGSTLLSSCTSQDVVVIVEAFAELPNLINEYRKQEGLSEIPLSPSMTAVALKHVMDLASYQPHLACNPQNLHSWSSNGNWTAGCFDLNNSATHSIMWNKPKEIANYPDLGYEISTAGTATPSDALATWKKSSGHNDVILNKGTWANRSWKALGAVVLQGYGCAWFGEVEE